MIVFRFLGRLFLWLVALLCLLWAMGALHFDFPLAGWREPVVIVFLIVAVAAIFFVRGFWRKIGAVFLCFFVVLVWWRTIKPGNDGHWQPDVAELAWAEVQGDDVTFHNVRNCEYRSEADYTARWETRTVHLSHLTGIDLAIDYWGSPSIAHPILSFQFDDGLPIAFSIETRKQLGQVYSAIGGLYRQFTLIYLVSDERDVIRLRTNYRKEQIYLYRTTISAEHSRERFLEYIKSLNDLRDYPRWYNAITTNCTTSIRAQHPPHERIHWDWRMLVNGYGDQMMYEHDFFVTGGLPFAELKAQSLIDAKAQAADQDPDFSTRIREGVPGFSEAHAAANNQAVPE